MVWEKVGLDIGIREPIAISCRQTSSLVDMDGEYSVSTVTVKQRL